MTHPHDPTEHAEPVSAPRRRSPYLLPTILLAVVVAGGGAGLFVITKVVNNSDRHRSAAPPVNPGRQESPPPATSGDPIEWALAAQTKALLAGDEAGWLAQVDRSDPKVVATYRRIFHNLRGLKVSALSATSTPGRLTQGADLWRSDVTFHYCLGDRSCSVNDPDDKATLDLRATTTWRVKAGPAVLAGIAIDTRRKGIFSGDGGRPYPWEGDDLATAAGRRAIVAAPRDLASTLPRWVAAADRAAAVADRFASYGSPPRRYLIFLAGKDQWRRWFGGEKSRYVAGYAHHTNETAIDIVIDTTKVGVGDAGVLRHEMGHVVTLLGGTGGGDLWLVEGIAEYIQWTGRPARSYDNLGTTRQLVRAGRWNGHINVDEPRRERDSAAQYGLGFLALRCIAGRYGEDRLFAFFEQVVRKADDEREAAPRTLGASWAAVDRACAAEIRRAIR